MFPYFNTSTNLIAYSPTLIHKSIPNKETCLFSMILQPGLH